MQKAKKWMKRMLLGMACAIGVLCAGRQSVLADTISLSVERFVLGGGFVVEPHEVEFTDGELYSTVLPRALQQYGYKAISNADSQWGYYMQGIENANCELQVPEVVQNNILKKKGITLTGKKSQGNALCEFDYSAESGWMYTVNNKYVLGMSSVPAKDGDVVRLMFTLSNGADVFGYNPMDKSEYYYNNTPLADKTELVRLMSEINSAIDWWKQAGEKFDEKYVNAKEVMIKINASESEVRSAINLLKSVKADLPPATITAVGMRKTSVNMLAGETMTLAYRTIPSYAKVDNEFWTSSNENVAKVDQTGKVTAVSAGTAVITVRLNGMYETKTTVTVRNAVQSVQLNRSSLTLRLDEGSEKLNYVLLPSGSEASVVWTSSNTGVATVTANGLVKPCAEGTAVITATADNGKTATCQVTVLPSLKKAFENGTPVVSVRAASSRSVQISWNAYTYAQSYIVYRRTPGSGWAQLGTVSGTSYTDNSAQPQTIYYYTVKATSSRWGGTVESKYDGNKSVTTPADPAPTPKPAEKKYASEPQVANHVYNGGWQTGVAAGSGFSLSGTTSAVDAGTYTVWATPDAGYVWPDGSSGTRTLTWSMAKADQAVYTAVSVKTYKMSALKKKAYSFTVGGSAQGGVSYRVARVPAGGAKYITVDGNGRVTLKKKAPGGIYEIAVSTGATANLNAAEKIVQINVTKNTQKITAKKTKMTYKVKQLKKGNKSYSIKGKAKGGITYRLTGAPDNGWGFVSVSGKGKVTVRKNAPKGTYLITLTAKETKEYAPATRVVKVVVK